MTQYILPCSAVLALALPLAAAGTNHKHHAVPAPVTNPDDVVGLIFEQNTLADIRDCLGKAFGRHGTGIAYVGNVHCQRNVDDQTGVAAILVHKGHNGLDNAMIAIEDSPQSKHVDVTLAHATRSGPWTTQSYSYADGSPFNMDGKNARLLPFARQVVKASKKLDR